MRLCGLQRLCDTALMKATGYHPKSRPTQPKPEATRPGPLQAQVLGVFCPQKLMSMPGASHGHPPSAALMQLAATRHPWGESFEPWSRRAARVTDNCFESTQHPQSPQKSEAPNGHHLTYLPLRNYTDRGWPRRSCKRCRYLWTACRSGCACEATRAANSGAFDPSAASLHQPCGHGAKGKGCECCFATAGLNSKPHADHNSEMARDADVGPSAATKAS